MRGCAYTVTLVLIVALITLVSGIITGNSSHARYSLSRDGVASSHLRTAQSGPYLTSSQVANFANSMTLSSPGQLSLFSFATGGTYYSSEFSIGSYKVGVDRDGNIAAALAVTGSASDNYTTSENYYTMGGAGVSGFNYYGEISRLDIPPVQPTTTFTFSFTLPESANVVFMATAGGQDYLNLSGAPGITVDATWNQPGGSAVTVANASLSAGVYHMKEVSTNHDGGSPDRADLVGIFAFAETQAGFIDKASSAIPSFRLDVSPSTLKIPETGAGAYIITAVPEHGFSCSDTCITLSIDGLPSGTSFSFTQSNIAPGQQTTLEIFGYVAGSSTTEYATPGDFGLTIQAQAGSILIAKSAILVIQRVVGVENTISFSSVDITNSSSCPGTPPLDLPDFSNCMTIQQNFYIVVAGATPSIYWAQNIVGYGNLSSGGFGAFNAYNFFSIDPSTGQSTLLGCNTVVVLGECVDEFTPQSVSGTATFSLTTYISGKSVYFETDYDGSAMTYSPYSYTVAKWGGTPVIYMGPLVGLSEAFITPPQLIIGGPPTDGNVTFVGVTSGSVSTSQLEVGTTYGNAPFVDLVVEGPVAAGQFPDQSGEVSEDLGWQITPAFPTPSVTFLNNTADGSTYQGICFF